MTREELKEHCENLIRTCEMWARLRGDEEPYRKVYEEHKLTLELLEQESVLDKIRAEIESYKLSEDELSDMDEDSVKWGMKIACDIVDRYRAESEPQEGEVKDGRKII